MNYALRISRGPWSAGTRVKIISAEQDNPMVVVEVLNKNRNRFECNMSDLVKLRNRSWVRPMNRSERRANDPIVQINKEQHERH